MDITGLAHLFGGELALAQKVVQALDARGYRARVAVADTVGAAWAMTRYGWRRKAERRTGGQENLLENVLLVAAGKAAEVLQRLPVQCLRLPAETACLLEQLGIACVEQLMGLPRPELAARFDAVLLDRLDQALGEKPEVFIAHRPLPTFATGCSLETPTDRRDEIEHLMDHLVNHLAGLLSDHDQGALQVQCHFESLGNHSLAMQVGLFQPTACARHLSELLRMQLETVRLHTPVVRIRVCAITTVRLSARQHELWNEPARDAARHLALLIDRLSSRLGHARVVGVRLQPGVLPERAYREISLTAPGTDRATKRRLFRPHQRPLWLYNPPLPLQVVAVVADGPPIFLHYQSQKHDVAHYWGPERIETAWWRGACVRRDYYRVETNAGSRFWIFRRLTDGKWFLHGCFD
jgi:protein ImuB